MHNYLDRERAAPVRILIADDLPPLVSALRRALRPLGEVTAASGGTDPYAVCLDAIHQLTTERPSVVVVDGLEGYGATVADIARAEGIPVVAFTSEPGRFRRLGIPVVVKPDVGPLLAAVRAMLGVSHG